MTTNHNDTPLPEERRLPGNDTKPSKRLFRSNTDKMLAGVAGGMAEYTQIDVSLVRLLWVFITIVSAGATFWLYIMLWLLLPTGDNARGRVASPVLQFGEKSMGILAWILIGLGLLWLLSNVGVLPMLAHGLAGVMHLIGIIFWPVLLLAGGWLLLRKLGHTDAMSEKVQNTMPEGDSLKERVRSGYTAVREKTPLKRDAHDKVLLGVCAGIAHWLNIDTAVVRILWALFSIASLGTGVILYIILAIIMPEDDQEGAIETVEGEVLDPTHI